MAPSKTNRALSSGNGHASHAEKTSIGSSPNGQKPVQEPNTTTRTDYSRWRLLDDGGRQTWEYLETDETVKKWPQSTADKYFLGLPTVCYHSWVHGIAIEDI
jgi:lanosterol synthase